MKCSECNKKMKQELPFSNSEKWWMFFEVILIFFAPVAALVAAAYRNGLVAFYMALLPCIFLFFRLIEFRQYRVSCFHLKRNGITKWDYAADRVK